jgi:hypothetical protein
MFLEQVLRRVTTMWTTGGRVGELFMSPLIHHGIRYDHKYLNVCEEFLFIS